MLKRFPWLRRGLRCSRFSQYVVDGVGANRREERRMVHWGADLSNTKYSALDQINRDNVKNLRVVWRWKADNFGPRPQNNLEATPLMVGGVLYTTAARARRLPR